MHLSVKSNRSETGIKELTVKQHIVQLVCFLSASIVTIAILRTFLTEFNDWFGVAVAVVYSIMEPWLLKRFVWSAKPEHCDN